MRSVAGAGSTGGDAHGAGQFSAPDPPVPGRDCPRRQPTAARRHARVDGDRTDGSAEQRRVRGDQSVPSLPQGACPGRSQRLPAVPSAARHGHCVLTVAVTAVAAPEDVDRAAQWCAVWAATETAKPPTRAPHRCCTPNDARGATQQQSLPARNLLDNTEHRRLRTRIAFDLGGRRRALLGPHDPHRSDGPARAGKSRRTAASAGRGPPE